MQERSTCTYEGWALKLESDVCKQEGDLHVFFAIAVATVPDLQTGQ